MSVTLEQLEAFLREKPPRDVPRNILQQRVTGGFPWGALASGILFFTFGSALASVFFPWNLRTEVLLDSGFGTAASGIVTAREATGMTVNEVVVQRIEYRFTTDDQAEVIASCYVIRRPPRLGDEVEVQYLQADPVSSRIVGGQVNAFGYFGMMVIIFPVAGLGMMIGSFCYGRGERRILTHGEFAMASVKAVQETSVSVNDHRRYRITLVIPGIGPAKTIEHYAYGADVGIAREHLATAEPVGILYDPRKPRRLIFAESLLPP